MSLPGLLASSLVPFILPRYRYISPEFNIIEFTLVNWQKMKESFVLNEKRKSHCSAVTSFAILLKNIPEWLWHGKTSFVIWDLSASVPLCHSQCEWIMPLSVILVLDNTQAYFSCGMALIYQSVSSCGRKHRTYDLVQSWRKNCWCRSYWQLICCSLSW